VHRFLRFAAASSLGLSLLFGPVYAPTAWADGEDDENTGVTPDDTDAPEFNDPQVNGVVYGIRSQAGARVVTVYDKDVGDGGLGVDVWVRDPKLAALITGGTVCVGRYVVAEGVRVAPGTLEAQGLTADMTTNCHTPPQ
jgi:hypothetical protein